MSSASTDFDLELFEKDTKLVADRVYFNENNNLRFHVNTSVEYDASTLIDFILALLTNPVKSIATFPPATTEDVVIGILLTGTSDGT